MQLSPHTPGLSERIVTITGSLEQLLHAVSLVVGKMQEDPAYYTYPSVNSAPPPAFGIYGRGHNYHGMAGPLPSLHAGMGLGLNPRGLGGPSTSQTQITVAVPDALIGAIVGRAGRTITELQAYSGARIKISQRGEFVPGTTNRSTSSPSQSSLSFSSVARWHICLGTHSLIFCRPLCIVASVSRFMLSVSVLSVYMCGTWGSE